jgi:hypothetical protein
MSDQRIVGLLEVYNQRKTEPTKDSDVDDEERRWKDARREEENQVKVSQRVALARTVSCANIERAMPKKAEGWHKPCDKLQQTCSDWEASCHQQYYFFWRIAVWRATLATQKL